MQSNHKSFKFFVIPNPDILWLKLAIGKGLEWFWNGGLTTDMWNSWKGAQLDSGRWIYKLCGYSSSLGSLWSTDEKGDDDNDGYSHGRGFLEWSLISGLSSPRPSVIHQTVGIFSGIESIPELGGWGSYHCSVSQRKRGNKPKTNCCILLSAFCQFGWDRWSTKGISVWPDKWIGV